MEIFMKNMSRRKVWLLFLLLLAYYVVFYTSITTVGQYFWKMFPDGLVIPELMASYNLDSFYNVLNVLGVAGRRAYLRNLVILDIVFPLLYAGFLMAFLAKLLKSLPSFGARWRFVLYIPVFTACFDLLENGAIMLLILFFPRQIPFLVSIANGFTNMKWNGFNLCLLLVVALVIRRLFGALLGLIQPQN